ncbi:unnamed protein product, partial [Eruca vesicaria subsp. sativa]|nr:unnamed protein product [Eruca vesicaria subsp. sativa]
MCKSYQTGTLVMICLNTPLREHRAKKGDVHLLEVEYPVELELEKRCQMGMSRPKKWQSSKRVP